MLAIDAGDLVVPLMFDLSSTSDTIVDEILIGRLEHCVRFSGEALQWMRSYLTYRFFSHSSKCYPLRWGVPQGSVLARIKSVFYISKSKF